MRRHARPLRTLECAVIDPARPYSREINRETDDEETHARALCWHGKGDVRVDTVPDPGIIKPPARLAGPTFICSRLPADDGIRRYPRPREHGEIIELGSEVTNLSVGDRVVVPFTISSSWFCKKGMLSACDRTNPNVEMATKVMGQSPAGCSDSVPCRTAIAADTPSGMACPTRSRRP